MKLLRNILIVIIILIAFLEPSIVRAAGCSEWDSLSDEQRYRLEYLYNYGKPFGYEHSLAAIGWQESQAGLYRINVASQDYGITQINIHNIRNILNVKSYWKEQEMISKVVTDDSLSAYLSIHILVHFSKVHNNNYKKVIMSYNIGNQKDKASLEKGLDYYNKVVYYLKIIERCSDFR